MDEGRKAAKLAKTQADRYVEELIEIATIPSISSLPEHAADIRLAAGWVCDRLRAIGFENVEVLPTEKHPVAYGEWLHAPSHATVLIYGHYDVQPVDPLDLWSSNPFEPSVRGDYLYGRGVSDMKGQLLAILKALELLRRTGELTVNVKVLVEGEEEIGSPSLQAFCLRERDRLSCDLILNTDGAMLGRDLPTLVYGLRGLAYFDVKLTGPDHDLHSGMFGGSVHNPAQVLCELVAGMHDTEGRVTLPGFYDKVQPLSTEDRAEIALGPGSDKEWRGLTGVPELFGEQGYTTLERVGARPTLEVNGLTSGYSGEGQKTVLPAKATAKISMRLVPDQDPKSVGEQLRSYFREHTPPTVRLELKTLAENPPVRIRRHAPGMSAAAQSLRETFGNEPVYTLEGGSIPAVSILGGTLGVDSVLMGFSLPDDNIHSLNERFYLPNLARGVEAYIRFFNHLATLGVV